MSEPVTKAEQIEEIFPWLLHWTIEDERIGNFRSDAFAVRTDEGLVLIDPLPLAEEAREGLKDACAIILTHGNHQRSAWRYRREMGAAVYAPSGATGLDEEPEHWYEEGDKLPGDLKAVRATGFNGACYLTFNHTEGTNVLFCGDLICHDVGGPYRFPVEPGYFEPESGSEDARRLMELPLQVMCTAHATPSLDGCREALQGAIDRVAK